MLEDSDRTSMNHQYRALYDRRSASSYISSDMIKYVQIKQLKCEFKGIETRMHTTAK